MSGIGCVASELTPQCRSKVFGGKFLKVSVSVLPHSVHILPTYLLAMGSERQNSANAQVLQFDIISKPTDVAEVRQDDCHQEGEADVRESNGCFQYDRDGIDATRHD